MIITDPRKILKAVRQKIMVSKMSFFFDVGVSITSFSRSFVVVL